MELHQVRYFLALCETRSFRRAAERCGVKQPSLSQAIAKLEHELGGMLFDRAYQRNGLTPLGALVRDDLAQLARGEAEARRKAAAFARMRLKRAGRRHIRRSDAAFADTVSV